MYSVLLWLTALSLIFRRQFLAWAGSHLLTVDPRRTAWLTVVTGAVIGVLVTISSVGAGALGVTALLLLYPRLPMAIIVGSDIAHAVPLTLLAGLGHWYLGSVDWTLLASLLTGSVPGIIIGSYPWCRTRAERRLAADPGDRADHGGRAADLIAISSMRRITSDLLREPIVQVSEVATERHQREADAFPDSPGFLVAHHCAPQGTSSGVRPSRASPSNSSPWRRNSALFIALKRKAKLVRSWRNIRSDIPTTSASPHKPFLAKKRRV